MFNNEAKKVARLVKLPYNKGNTKALDDYTYNIIMQVIMLMRDTECNTSDLAQEFHTERTKRVLKHFGSPLVSIISN